jgi:hypothetical protein
VTSPAPKTIAWDVDDVLNSLVRAWFETRTPPDPRVTYAELRCNPPHEALGLSHLGYLASLDAFRLSRFDALSPRAEVLAWFELHGDRFRHLAVTATPLHTAPTSAAWVLRHFGRWIRTVTIVPSARPFDASKRWESTKLEHLAWLRRVDALVDDLPANLLGASAAGVLPVTFPQPWNEEAAPVERVLEAMTRRLEA